MPLKSPRHPFHRCHFVLFLGLALLSGLGAIPKLQSLREWTYRTSPFPQIYCFIYILLLSPTQDQHLNQALRLFTKIFTFTWFAVVGCAILFSIFSPNLVTEFCYELSTPAEISSFLTSQCLITALIALGAIPYSLGIVDFIPIRYFRMITGRENAQE